MIVVLTTLIVLLGSEPAGAPGASDVVSLIQLIATPAAFDQKRVIVHGYVALEFEHQMMYLNEADAKHGITRNGVWLYVDEETYRNRARFHRQYGLVEGTFDGQRRGHLSLASGSMQNITRIEVLK
jgi:hypothetical protein